MLREQCPVGLGKIAHLLEIVALVTMNPFEHLPRPISLDPSILEPPGQLIQGQIQDIWFQFHCFFRKPADASFNGRMMLFDGFNMLGSVISSIFCTETRLSDGFTGDCLNRPAGPTKPFCRAMIIFLT